jgi:ABC-type branched-subunit amino acid transport system substrate-binding protein
MIHMRKPRMRLTATVAALTVFAAGCGATSSDDPVKVAGPGVTSDKITLGALTDLSSAYAPLGKNVVQGNQIYINELNDSGGVCGRKVELQIKDHGYDTKRATSEYFDLEPNVLGFVQVLGAPIANAIQDDVLHQKLLTAPTSWSTDLLNNPYLMIVGATYQVDTINGVDHLASTGAVRSGDTIGQVYIDDEYGRDALAGSRFAAKQLGLNLQEVSVTETDTDLGARVAKLKAMGAKAVMLATNPRQTATIVGAAAQLGLTVPFMTNNPGYAPELLSTPAAPALQQLLTIVTSVAPFSADIPKAHEIANAYKKTFADGTPGSGVDYGYLVAKSFGAVLDKACKHGDLSREGVLRAFREVDGLDTGGLSAPLRFSVTARPSATKSFVLRPDPKAPGGLSLLTGLFESNMTKEASR